MFDRRLVEYFDWKLMWVTLLLAGVGASTLYSAVTTGEPSSQQMFFKKQLIWMGAGFAVMATLFFLNYRIFDRWGFGVYFGCIVLLFCVLLFGKYVGGSRRWLMVGPFTLQPSELAKIAVIVIVARYYSRRTTTKGFTMRELFVPLLLVFAPFILIVKQPDLGTAMLIFIIAGSMTLFVKIEKRTLIYIFSSCSAAVPLVWFFLQGYQKQRILTFLNPDRDPLGTGYHIIQSKIAIGSGMLFGKGYLEGTQKALAFLPEQHTDFILSVLAEEWGFAGCGVLLLLYLLLIVLGLNIAGKCRNPFGTVLAFGVTAMFFWQIVINTGMVMGLMPVVGVPLPLISYGGSSVITTMIGIGLLMSISMRRFMAE